MVGLCMRVRRRAAVRAGLTVWPWRAGSAAAGCEGLGVLVLVLAGGGLGVGVRLVCRLGAWALAWACCLAVGLAAQAWHGRALAAGRRHRVLGACISAAVGCWQAAAG